MSSRARLVGAIVAVVVLAFGATRIFAASASPAYRTVPVRRANVNDVVSITGAVRAATETHVSFKISGRVASKLVSVGDKVTAGQPLARLEGSDLEIAVAQAKAGLSGAQAKYDLVVAGAAPQDVAIAQQSVDNAERTLAATKSATAAQLASAQISFTKLRTAYASSQTGFQVLGDGVVSDVGTFTSSFGGSRAALAQALVDFTSMSTADITAAKAAIGQADAALGNAQSDGQQISNALDQWRSARDGVIAAWLQFDDAVARGVDTSGAATQYQSALLAYTNATTQLSAALAAASAQVTAAATSAAAAQGALNSSTSRIDASLDKVRADLLGFQSAATGSGQLAATLAGKLAQMTAYASVIADAVGGTYLSAQQALVGAQQSGDSAVVGAQNAYDSAAAMLAKTGAPARSFDVAAAYAGVLSAQAALDKATSDLASAALVAPTAGVVAQISAQPGELVAAGAPLVDLLDTSSVTLHGNVGETDVAELQVGQTATVTIDAVRSASPVTGHVTTLDPVATIQQGVPVYGIDVTIDHPDPRIRAGMSGTVSISVANVTGALVVPTYAVRSSNGARTVAILRDGKVVEVPVQLGVSDDSVTQVTGVAEGDAVLVPLLTGATIRSTATR
ncbi:MAG: efflux RND transporter periplasmic adaptor subunit [Chloroflexota bacterium]|nr:efflux RND transporter periplasmic adaptor subunit [Chloroflexota bacterium]